MWFKVEADADDYRKMIVIFNIIILYREPPQIERSTLFAHVLLFIPLSRWFILQIVTLTNWNNELSKRL